MRPTADEFGRLSTIEEFHVDHRTAGGAGVNADDWVLYYQSAAIFDENEGITVLRLNGNSGGSWSTWAKRTQTTVGKGEGVHFRFKLDSPNVSGRFSLSNSDGFMGVSFGNSNHIYPDYRISDGDIAHTDNQLPQKVGVWYRVQMQIEPDGTPSWRIWEEAAPENQISLRITDAATRQFFQPRNFWFWARGTQNPTLYLSDYQEGQIYRTEYGYDMADNLLNVTDAHGNVTTMEYDGLSRKIGMDDPDMGTWSYGYDWNGNLTRQTDANGDRLCFYYDELGRITEKWHSGASPSACPTDPSGIQLADYGYSIEEETLGLVESVSRSNGLAPYSESFEYDMRGRLTQHDRTIAGRSFSRSYTYDLLDRPLTMTNPDGEMITYGYDFEGAHSLQAGSDTIVSGIQYNEIGQVEQIIRPTGQSDTITTYSYGDATENFRLERVNTPSIADFNYTAYDNVGNITAMSSSFGATSGVESAEFTYDSLYRLAEADYSTESSARTYQYDAIGNIHTLEGSLPYDYDNVVTAPASCTNTGEKPHAVKRIGSDEYCYDENGNMIRRTDGQIVYDQIFDVENRLVTVAVGTELTQFGYDVAGGRILTIKPDGTKIYYPFAGYEEEVGFLDAPPTATPTPTNTPVPTNTPLPQPTPTHKFDFELTPQPTPCYNYCPEDVGKENKGNSIASTDSVAREDVQKEDAIVSTDDPLLEAQMVEIETFEMSDSAEPEPGDHAQFDKRDAIEDESLLGAPIAFEENVWEQEQISNETQSNGRASTGTDTLNLNPSFENGWTGWDQWLHAYSSSTAVARSTGGIAGEQPNEGDYGIGISNLVYGGVKTTNMITGVDENGQYTFSVSLRRKIDPDVMAGGYGFTVWFYDASGKRIGYRGLYSHATGSAEWDTMVRVLESDDIPATTEKMIVGFMFYNGSGIINLDNFSVVRSDTSPQSANLVTNPSFENGMTGWTSWSSVTSNATNVWRSTWGFGGPQPGQGLHGIAIHNLAYAYVAMNPTNLIGNIDPNGTYELSVGLRRKIDPDIMAGGYGFVVWCYDADGNYIRSVGLYGNETGSSGWEDFNRTLSQLNIPAGTKQVRVGFLLYLASGWVNIDGMSMIRTDGSSPSTNLIPNASFENDMTGWEIQITSASLSSNIHRATGGLGSERPGYGDYGLAIHNTAYGGIRTKLLDVSPVGTYDLSVGVRRKIDPDVMAGGYGFVVWFYDANGSFIKSKGLYTHETGGAGWSTYERMLEPDDIPANAVKMRVGYILYRGTGYANIDNFRVTPVNEYVTRRTSYAAAGQTVATRITSVPSQADDGLYYTYNDHLGSNSLMTTKSGSVVAGSLAKFAPFGGYRTIPTQTLTDLGFTGHKENRDIGLTYMNARYYVPEIGRFASADTLVPEPSLPQSFNRYSYVNNNGLIYTDPSGHSRVKGIDDIFEVHTDTREAKDFVDRWNKGPSNSAAIEQSIKDSTVIIEATVTVYYDDGTSETYTSASLGTAIGRKKVLTHNHFGESEKRANGRTIVGKEITQIALYDAEGNHLDTLDAANGDFDFTSDGETGYFYLTNFNGQLTPTKYTNNSDVKAGDYVAIATLGADRYGNKNRRVYIQWVEVLSVDDTTITLDYSYRTGDSGGGIFHNGVAYRKQLEKTS